MQNSTSTLIALFVAAVFLFVVPLVTLTTRNDNVVQEDVNLIVKEFVTDIKNTGVLTQEKYQSFQNKLAATGNTYNIDMEIKHLDENPGKKLTQANYSKIGEDVYWSEYTSQIIETLESSNDSTITLKKGDRIYVSVSNQNSTAAQTLQSSTLKIANDGEQVMTSTFYTPLDADGVK